MLRTILMITALIFTFVGDASAQALGMPASANNAASTPACQAGNRNWSCGGGGAGPSGAPVTVCLETVVNGVRQGVGHDITFISDVAKNNFINSAPAGTQYVPCGTTPSCTPNTETKTEACPTGQIGLITEQRTTCVNGDPTNNTTFTVISNTCHQVCTETHVDTTLDCPAGQTGSIVMRTYTNQGNVCGQSATVTVSNTCHACTETHTDTPSACPAGQQGNIITRLFMNYQGVCGGTHTDTINNCTGCTETHHTTTQACPAGQTGTGISTTAYLNYQGVCNATHADVVNDCHGCTETHHDMTAQCPAGQTGNGIVTRIFANYGGVCGQNFSQEVSRDCHPVTCTQTFTDSTSDCPAGQSGNIITRTYSNYLGTCGDTHQTVISNTCHQTCDPSTYIETQACGAGYTGNQTRTVTVNTGNVCGSTTYSDWNRSQCHQICNESSNDVTSACPAGQEGSIVTRYFTNYGNTCGATHTSVVSNTCHTVCHQSYTDSTQQCPAGQTGTGIVTRTFSNYGDVCGASFTQEVSHDCTPNQEIQILDEASCEFCTDTYGMIGLEFNKNDPNYVYAYIVGSNGAGQVGANCQNDADLRNDPIKGRHLIARVPLSSISQSTFDMTLTFRAAVSGATCSLAGTSVNGFKYFSVTIHVDHGHSSTTYVSQASVGGNTYSGEQAAQAIVSGTNGATAYADTSNAGLFSQCGGHGAKPRYSLWVGANASVN